MLIFTHSTMGGGKSALLISKYYNSTTVTVPIKSEVDTRTSRDIISSRNGFEIVANPMPKDLDKEETYKFLENLYKKHHNSFGIYPKFFLLDEAQFLTEEQVNGLLLFSLKNDVIIECFGLLTDFESKLFEGSKRLVEVADKIEHIPAYAKDGRIAKQNLRLKESDEQVLIGGDDVYKAVSNKEYFLGGKQ